MSEPEPAVLADRVGWAGATLALLATTLLLVCWSAVDQYVPATADVLVRVTLLDIGIALLAGGVVVELAALTIGRRWPLPWPYAWALFAATFLLLTQSAGASRRAWYLAVIVLVVGSSVLGYGLGRLVVTPRAAAVPLATGMTVLLGPLGALVAGSQGPPAAMDLGDSWRDGRDPGPSAPGPHAVATLTYGSGVDARARYGADVDWVIPPVDASALVGGWDERRTQVWGFGVDALPRNATVWYPQGDGPFPLVLIVHGNKSATTASEQGFTYLAQHLASHGFVTAAVDLNFLTTGVLDRGGGLTGIEVARGWLLLQHLRAWTALAAADGPFHGRVAMDDIALIGHSRGGEAIAVAAFLNGRGVVPDHPDVPVGTRFGIRSLLALAPSDGQYRPNGGGVVLDDVNYLVVHGTHDADVVGFDGLDQYERVELPADGSRIKAALVVERANHTRFNARWGDRDLGYGLSKSFLDVDVLLTPTEQQRLTRGYATAFLHATLHREEDSVDLLADYRVGAEWLPRTRYASRFSDGTGTVLHDPGSDRSRRPRLHGFTAAEVVALPLRSGKGLERMQRLRWGAGDTAPTMELDVGDATEPRTPAALRLDAVALADDGRLADGVTVRFTDADGRVAQLPLANAMPLPHALDAQYLTARWLQDRPSTQAIPQTITVPLHTVTERLPDFDLTSLREVGLRFDPATPGTVLVGDVRLVGR